MLILKQDITVFEEGKDITNTINITYDASGNTEINFSKEMQYDADESTGNKANSPIGLVINLELLELVLRQILNGIIAV